MAKKRFINTKFWSDTYICTLDPIERYLYLYFLTNEHTDICGIYELPLKIMAVETGLDMEMVFKILKRFKKEKKIYYIEGWVFVRNFLKHQIINDSIIQGITRSIKDVPEPILAQIRQIEPDYPQTDTTLTPEADIPKPTLKPKPTLTPTPKDIISAEAVSKKPYKQTSDRVITERDKTYKGILEAKRPSIPLVMSKVKEFGEEEVVKKLGHLRELKSFNEINDHPAYFCGMFQEN